MLRTCRRDLARLLMAGSVAWAGMAQAMDVVTLPATLRRPALTLHWAPLANDGAPHPVVVALHGCGGLYQRGTRMMEARFEVYVEQLHGLGFHVLLPDSFGSRGLSSLCTLRYGTRSVGIAQRRADVMDALAWLKGQAEVDSSRIALLGWDNGATTALSAMDARRQPAPPPLAAVALFYPACRRMEGVDARAGAVLLQLGGADDWTPPQPCEQLARRWRAAGRDVVLDVYPDAFHGFDSANPVRFRPEVPNGATTDGVHQGGNPEAAEASLARLAEFLGRHLGGREPAPRATLN